MCTEEKRMGMVMGEAKAAQPTGGQAAAAPAEPAKMNSAPVQKAEPQEAVKTPDAKAPMQEDKNSVEAEAAAEAAPEEPAESENDTPAEEEIHSIVIEAAQMHVICPIIIQIGARTAQIFDDWVEMSDFDNDEDDLVIDILKHMYRAGQYFEAMALLELTFLLKGYYEPVELLNIVQNTGDEDCCRLFLNGFICESCRTDLMVLKNSIRKKTEDNDGVSEHE